MKKINFLNQVCRFKIFFSLNLFVVLFATGFRLNAQEIEGPTLVCNSTVDYSIYVTEVGSTVIWDTEGIVQLNSLQGNDSASFTITGSGSGKIIVAVYNNMDVKINEDDHEIWAGPLTLPVL